MTTNPVTFQIVCDRVALHPSGAPHLVGSWELVRRTALGREQQWLETTPQATGTLLSGDGPIAAGADNSFSYILNAMSPQADEHRTRYSLRCMECPSPRSSLELTEAKLQPLLDGAAAAGGLKLTLAALERELTR